MIKKLLFILTISISIYSNAQNIKLKAHEDTLIKLLEEVHFEADFNKAFSNSQIFKQQLKKVLKHDESFNFPFDSLSTLMSTKTSPDKSFRIFNWNIEKENEEQFYQCLIMKYNVKTKEYIIIELFDKSNSAIDPEYMTHSSKNWYGALYYDIIPVKKGNNTIYTLLAWDGNNMYSNKKIIETMIFKKDDDVKFGLPIFNYNKLKIKRRIIFQYNKRSYMSLKHKRIKKIDYLIFDHLAPPSSQLEGMHEWYVTDLSFDAFKFENNKWVFIENFYVKSDKPSKNKTYNTPR